MWTQLFFSKRKMCTLSSFSPVPLGWEKRSGRYFLPRSEGVTLVMESRKTKGLGPWYCGVALPMVSGPLKPCLTSLYLWLWLQLLWKVPEELWLTPLWQPLGFSCDLNSRRKVLSQYTCTAAKCKGVRILGENCQPIGNGTHWINFPASPFGADNSGKHSEGFS